MIKTPRFKHLFYTLKHYPKYVLIGCCLSPISHADNNLYNWQDVNFIQKAFIEVALKNEYQKTDMTVVKWVKPIHYAFYYEHLPQPNRLIEAMANTHMAQLAEISQHPISLNNSAQPINFNIVLTKEAFFRASIEKWGGKQMIYLANEANCIGHFKQNKRHEITQATVIIPVDHAATNGLLAACIVEETTQVLGLPNDSDWVNPSIANDASKLDLLTGLDYVMLKMLYDKRLEPGMPLEKSKPMIGNILQDYEQQGIIKNAYRLVKKSGLYQFNFSE